MGLLSVLRTWWEGENGRKPCGCPDDSRYSHPTNAEHVGDRVEWEVRETRAAVIRIPGSRRVFRCLDCGESFEGRFIRYRADEEKSIEWKDGYGPEVEHV